MEFVRIDEAKFDYRKIVPGLPATGYRVVVPEHAGFGRSGKPVGEEIVATFLARRGAQHLEISL